MIRQQIGRWMLLLAFVHVQVRATVFFCFEGTFSGRATGRPRATARDEVGQTDADAAGAAGAAGVVLIRRPHPPDHPQKGPRIADVATAFRATDRETERARETSVVGFLPRFLPFPV